MDFKDIILVLSDRVAKLKDSLLTEEATKTSLVLPFIQALGYDFFNPHEFVPEYTCDIGTKKGEKVDYAILKDGKPIILIECKHCDEELAQHDGQLLRYFHVSNAKFGVLTNGINYRFYTDLEKQNKMDEKPFLDVNMLDLKENQIDELKKFHKSYFDVATIIESASELKYTSELKNLFANEFSTPSPDFVKYFVRQIYDGRITENLLETFTELTKKSLNAFITDRITAMLKTAIEMREKGNEPKDTQATTVVQQLPEGVLYMSEDGKVLTTKTEIEAFFIVRSILRKHINAERITCRDAQNYFSVFIDDNNRKPVCRFYFNNPDNLRIAFLDENKKEILNQISTLDAIFSFSDQLIDVAKRYA